MELDIRGEMEAAANELEQHGADFEGSSQGAPPASEPETTSESTEQPVAPPASPATEDAQPGTKEDPQPPPDDYELPIGGSIPVPRVRKIIENARAKARAEAQAQLDAIAWAKEVDKAQVEEALNVIKFANDNPVEFYRQVTSRLRSDPALAQEIERVWSPTPAAPEQPKADADPKPQPDVLLEDGRLVFSADQMEKLLGWQERNLESKVSQKLKPIEDARRQQEQHQAIEQESLRVLAEVAKWPGMQDPENRKAVASAMFQQKLGVDAAYRAVVLPKLTDTKAIEDRVRKQVLAELKTKARASTDNPTRVVSDPESFKGKSIREILEATAAEMGLDE